MPYDGGWPLDVIINISFNYKIYIVVVHSILANDSMPFCRKNVQNDLNMHVQDM